MLISEAIAELQRILRQNGDSEFWILGKDGWEEVQRIAEVINADDDLKFTACVIGIKGHPEGDMLATERGYRPPSRTA